MAYNDGHVVMENVRILFRNFTGKEGKYNREGDRNFSVLLDDERAKILAAADWNVKWLAAKEGYDKDQAYLTISVKYGKGKPPRIVMITSRGRTTLNEDEVEMLDWADIRTADLIIRPYHWEVSDASGIKAYLQSLFITIEENALDLKYADLDNVSIGEGGYV